MLRDPMKIRAAPEFLHNALADQEECPWHDTDFVVVVFVVPHLAALGSAFCDWCKGCRVQEGFVVAQQVPRSG